MITIPTRLQKPEYRFCKVMKKSKRAFEVGWQKDKNYKYDDPELLKWLKSGGNYGVIGGFGGLIIIDCDQEEIGNAVKKKLPMTFAVISGSGKGGHYYFICNDLNKPIRLYDPLGDSAGDVGDVQATGKYVVGANCIHPSGGKYELVSDMRIATITSEKLRYVLSKWIKRNDITIDEERHDSIDDLNINVSDIVSTSGFKPRGHEFQGGHPFHGSETGQNFTIDPNKNVWHCFRHGTGGSALSLLAIRENILSCEDCERGRLRGDKFKEVLSIAKGLFGKKKRKKKREKVIPEYEKEEDEFKMIIPKGNYIREYFDYACELTDAYPEYHLQEAFHQLSLATMGKARIKIMPFSMKVNLFQQKTGVSTTSRKSTAGKISEIICQLSGLSEYRHPDSFSIESLMSNMSKRNIGYVRQSELGNFYKNIKRSYNSGSEEFFCNIYDCPKQFKRSLRKEKIVITDPYLNIIGGTTIATFKSYIDNFETFLDSGFFARFLFTYPMRWKKRKPIRKIDLELERLQEGLGRRLNIIYDFFKYASGKVSFIPCKDAMDYFNDWQERYEDFLYKSDNVDRESSFYSRAADNALKLACLIEIGEILKVELGESEVKNNINNADNGDNMYYINNYITRNGSINYSRETPCDLVISLFSLRAAVYYVQNLFIPHAKRVMKNIEVLMGADQLRRVYDLIIRFNGRVDHSKLLRYSHMRLKEFGEVIDTLHCSGMIKIEGDPKVKKDCFYIALNPDKGFEPPEIRVPAFTETYENGN